MSGGLNKAFALALAIQFQVIGLIATGWLAGSWLNQEYPQSFNWYKITFPLAILSVIQMLHKMYYYIKKKI